MRVIGIDPGLATVGYGIVEKNGDKYRELDYGYIGTPAGSELPRRLLDIYHSIKLLIEKFTPDELAMEKLFFCKNSKTALQVGEARGAIMIAAAEKKIDIFEYTPLQVKQAATGYGRADKKQVQQAVCLLLRLSEVPRPDDAADALAIALCHLQSSRWQRLIEDKSSN
ncbi:MAG TPA: crossover junction endodeoxyribonuclease RuvC [Firmicutes bacterium]|nr:crossover junction endodeoxyribonuclease RuvC [Bacillota bacterium]